MDRKKQHTRWYPLWLFLSFLSIIGSGIISGKIFHEAFFKTALAEKSYANVWKATAITSDFLPSTPAELLKNLQTKSQAKDSKLQEKTGTNSKKSAEPATEAIKPLNPTETTDMEFSCTYPSVKKTIFTGKFLSITQDEILEPGSMSQVQVVMKNTGNTPWFSSESKCGNVPTVFLGTEKDRDRKSSFYPGIDNTKTWAGNNRIIMTTRRVEPGEIAVFRFDALAPIEPGIYREFFAPVVEGQAWIGEGAEFSVDIRVGYMPAIESQNLGLIKSSMNLSKIDFKAERKLEVSLSKQTMEMKLGDLVLRTFPVSTGAYKTPTPAGNFKIFSKQKVRIASKKPHYIMPLFMMFKNGGYGIHALPSLGNDRGVYWREALNHIGTPRSHGCIRLLPDDAQTVWDYADIGTVVAVRR